MYEDEDVRVYTYNDPAGFAESYTDGVRFVTDSPPAQFFYRLAKHRKTDYLQGAVSIPVISEQFRTIVAEYEPEKVEFYPVEIICDEEDGVDHSYSFMNILDNVDCFDRTRSQFSADDLMPAVIWSIEHLVIDESVIRGRHIFRMVDFETLIFVSGALRQAIEKAELSGVSFLDVPGPID